MNDYEKLADLLLPNVDKSLEYYENLYPKRNLPQGAEVTRFSPSPTGFLHIGSLFVSMIDRRVADKSKGIAYLRIEDTDKKREVEGGVRQIVTGLENFNIKFDEGVDADGIEFGNYGPYIQSMRKEIYQTYAKYLLAQGKAYPCFCTEGEGEELRKQQEKASVRPGYYGRYARCRNLSFEEIERRIKEGQKFVVRLRSKGYQENKVAYTDLIKGNMELSENDQDAVILKSDGVPTYHFAHAVDDHLMRTTIVIRGDEWLSSVPLHLELFEALGFEKPRYAHVAPIAKEEGGSKRKLSKRKDPEAAVSYYYELGIPNAAITEYMLTLANSNYEEWRISNPKESTENFDIQLENMSVSMPLFDMVKFMNISKNVVASMSAEEVYSLSLSWAKEFDKELAELMLGNEEYTKKIFNIERNDIKPRKDIAKWSDVRENVLYFYDNLFEADTKNGYNFDEKYSMDEIRNVLDLYLRHYNPQLNKDEWFENLKDLCEQAGYCKDVKTYKKNPESYKGHVGDFAAIIRVALTNRKNTPDLYEMMQVMEYDRVVKRLKQV